MSEVTLTIDDIRASVPEGLTILEAARKAEVYIPALCAFPGLSSAHGVAPDATVYREGKPFENESPGKTYDGCQLCVVEVDGDGTVLACTTPVRDGMIVHTATDSVREIRRKNLTNILIKHPHACLVCPQQEGCDRLQCSSNVPQNERCCWKFAGCELRKVAAHVGVIENIGRYVPKNIPVITDKLIIYDYSLCIGCLRCVRVCKDMQDVGALGFVYRDGEITVGSVASSLKESGCKFCGACIEVCPTGTLKDVSEKAKAKRAQTLNIPSPILPPEEWMDFTESNVSAVPDVEGVFKLFDEQKNIIYIKGAMHMREEMEEQLNAGGEARYFLYEEDPMYTQRESEFLQMFLQQYGKLPALNADLDDLFD